MADTHNHASGSAVRSDLRTSIEVALLVEGAVVGGIIIMWAAIIARIFP